MNEFFGSVWWLLVTLGLLVTFHEFGHFWVARRCGVKVLRFSVGFGKPLWSRRGRDGTEYAIGAIPLGGYVKFLDARESDTPDLARREPGEFTSASLWQRMLITVAGPAFNVLFTIAAFWAMFVVGRPDYQPIIGTPTGIASTAGFQANDRFTAVDGDPVDSWTSALQGIAQAAMLHRDATVDVIDAQGKSHARVLPLSKLPADSADNQKAFDAIGLDLRPTDAVVASVQADAPAARGGLQIGDRVLRLNDTAIANFPDFTRSLAEQAPKDPHLHLLVQRGDAQVPIDLTAEPAEVDGKSKWIIGISVVSRSSDAVEHFGPLRAIPAAFAETWKTTRSTLSMVGSMLSGQASAKNLSSVITIAQVANASAHQGLAWFLSFLAVISLSLGILNLLPIPILDGGHLLYYLIEAVKGSPVSERTLVAGQYVGLALLVTLMSVAFYNDIVRLVAS